MHTSEDAGHAAVLAIGCVQPQPCGAPQRHREPVMDSICSCSPITLIPSLIPDPTAHRSVTSTSSPPTALAMDSTNLQLIGRIP